MSKRARKPVATLDPPYIVTCWDKHDRWRAVVYKSASSTAVLHTTPGYPIEAAARREAARWIEERENGHG